MKGFYEQFREESQIIVNRNKKYVYPTHFHKNMEIFICKRGRYRISVNEKEYEVSDGQIVVVDSYDLHGYYENLSSQAEDNCVLIIPYEDLTMFNAWRKGLSIVSPVICDENLCAQILSLLDEFSKEENSERLKKATANLILSLLYEKLSFAEGKNRGEVTLIRGILAYVQENFRGDVSRLALAKELGYTEAHVSRVFHKYLRIGLSEYVNDLRLAYVQRAKENGSDKTTLELIFEAGFKSEQTYYRYKKQALEKGNR